MLVIDTVSRIEKRNEFAYIVNQEFGYYIGRFSGCMMFILLATYVSDTFALRYALAIVGAIQIVAIPVAMGILKGCSAHAISSENELIAEERAVTGYE